jgi:hypothetical protein
VYIIGVEKRENKNWKNKKNTKRYSRWISVKHVVRKYSAEKIEIGMKEPEYTTLQRNVIRQKKQCINTKNNRKNKKW